MRNNVQFYINDRKIVLENPRADMTLLSLLREEMRLVGTKEGCAEGDCGACTVLVGRLGENGLAYQAVNACISFVAMMDGAHIVTVEALAKNGQLHWVQSALADYHGTQCGFCTPGIVMSLYAMWMSNPHPTRADVEKAMQGNLCRCTGYASIFRGIEARASQAKLADDPLVAHRVEMAKKLADLPQDSVQSESRAPFFMPTSLDELLEIYAKNPSACLVGGATDVGLWVTKFLRDISPVIFLGRVNALDHVDFADDKIRIGAMTSIDRAEHALAELIPELSAFWPLFAGQQVRNLGTIGGSIANGSPIGDIAPVMIALDAELVLQSQAGTRRIILADFFVDYGKQDRRAGEIVAAIEIPMPIAGALKVYKISKRKHEDITATMAAIRIEHAQGIITNARIAFGGMAATPKRARNAEDALLGARFAQESFRGAAEALNSDFQPLSDMRASAAYRMKASQNLLLRYYLDTDDQTEAAE